MSLSLRRGEDSLLAYNLISNHYKIKYCRDVVPYHETRDSIKGVASWQFKRGVSSFIFSRKIDAKKQFVSLRLWSVQHVIRNCLRQRQIQKPRKDLPENRHGLSPQRANCAARRAFASKLIGPINGGPTPKQQGLIFGFRRLWFDFLPESYCRLARRKQAVLYFK